MQNAGLKEWAIIYDALLRGDQKARSEFYNKQFSVGAMSPPATCAVPPSFTRLP